LICQATKQKTKTLPSQFVEQPKDNKNKIKMQSTTKINKKHKVHCKRSVLVEFTTK
jgi:hypothetical protein